MSGGRKQRNMDTEIVIRNQISDAEYRQQQAIDIEVCNRTPKFNTYDDKSKYLWGVIEFIFRLYYLLGVIILFLHQMENWRWSTTEIRWWTGAAAVVGGTWFLIQVLAAAITFNNEREYEAMGSNAVATISCAIPPSQYGMVYLAIMATGQWVTWTYLHIQIRDEGELLLTEGQRRSFSLKIWVFAGILLTDLIYGLLTRLAIFHAYIDHRRGKDPCRDAHALAVSKGANKDNFEADHRHEMPYAEAACEALDFASVFLGLAMGFFLMEHLVMGGNTTPGGNAKDWAPSTWMYVAGSAAIVAASIAVILFIVMLMHMNGENNRCMYKQCLHGFFFWIGFASWYFAVWYRMYVFIHDNARDGLTSEQDRRDWERLLWVLLYAAGNQLVLVFFHDMRCKMAGAFSRMPLLKHCYGC